MLKESASPSSPMASTKSPSAAVATSTSARIPFVAPNWSGTIVDMKKNIIIIVIIVTVFALSLLMFPPKTPVGDIYTVYHSDEVLEVIKTPDTVTANRLEQWDSESDMEQPHKFEEYKALGQPTKLNEANARQMAEILLSSYSYVWDSAKACVFNPGYRVRFSKSEQVVDVLFCFECDILNVFWNEQVIGGEDYDNVSSRLRNILDSSIPVE